MKLTYRHTLLTCYLSYITQAIVNNLSPLLFVIFRKQLGIELWQISLLITVNFALQIVIDLSSTLFVDRIGYRASVILASVLSACGLIGLGVFPQIFPHKYIALLLATLLSAIGGGLIEVVISPMVEAIPGDEKASAMSILHSFYCWGQAGVIFLSTMFFLAFGEGKWYLLPLLWAIVPLACALLFSVVPVASLAADESRMPAKSLLRNRYFLPMMILMICAGASELGMSQWASYFAEQGLGLNKTLGDLLGPCTFALFMGSGRLLFGLFGKRMKLERWIFASFLLCIVSYLLAALAPFPLLSLVGCAVCGLSVALMWPGTYSLGSRCIPAGGTLMFALFAFAGDIGCTSGPDVVGLFSGAVAENSALCAFFSRFIHGSASEVGMKAGMLLTTLFPVIGAIAAGWLLLSMKKHRNNDSAL